MSGSLWLGKEGQDTLPFIPRQRPHAVAADPIDELADRLEELIAAAVHPDEVAAILESDGMTDAHIRTTYGRHDSFELAEDLYARVERRYPPAAGPAADPWHATLPACLLRGLVFALPGLAYVLGAPLLTGPPDGFGLPAGTVPLLAGAVTGWVWNQGLSHRAYAWLGLGDRPAAAAALRTGAPLGAVLSALVALAASGPGELSAASFAAGQAVYLAAATVLLAMGRERDLLVALLPMAAGAAGTVAVDPPEVLRTGLLLLSLAAAAGFAWRALAGAAAAGGADDDRPGPRLAASVPYALFGLGTGVLVLYAAVGDVFADGAGAAVAAPSAVALTLSMGPAEWLLYRFRSESLAGLRASTTAYGFRKATVITIAVCLSGYLAILFALTVVGTLLWPGAPELGALRLTGLLLTGMVLWTALLLQSFGAVRSAAAVCCTAGGVQVLALATGAGHPHTVGPVVAGVAAVVLAGLVGALLGRATAHRV
ncbi:hypothetical protein [Streptomyces sp. BPTC-684]|uniref:hypothetical protein n=1 Tax=Streptomyces sp. BPTC-684 TaxID=3043734 RepID=UPI0024B1CDD2|nr:hypothetical protein [Streptomyces sp. BPTC-684]WHM39032.1 hypothetical protein QIY60_20655 [Streptomyces sp. BPTC-684]